MASQFIVPDASFYICFFDDIRRPDALIKFVNFPLFRFLTANIILSEFERYKVDTATYGEVVRNLEVFSYHNYGEILRPVLSESEMEKGESEVIAISCILNYQGRAFIAILDDDEPKKMLQRLIPRTNCRIIGTVGFIEICTGDYTIFGTKEAIQLLSQIKSSKFRIKEKIIDEVIQRTSEPVK